MTEVCAHDAQDPTCGSRAPSRRGRRWPSEEEDVCVPVLRLGADALELDLGDRAGGGVRLPREQRLARAGGRAGRVVLAGELGGGGGVAPRGQHLHEGLGVDLAFGAVGGVLVHPLDKVCLGQQPVAEGPLEVLHAQGAREVRVQAPEGRLRGVRVQRCAGLQDRGQETRIRDAAVPDVRQGAHQPVCVLLRQRRSVLPARLQQRLLYVADVQRALVREVERQEDIAHLRRGAPGELLRHHL
mmetsp:Transcript_31476/g.84506  ORF Transcript_31476/g.84506 Transcript_31476/m.84506 type:complete len:242 (+) Transcript_31476:352-1077(+)